MFNATLTYRLHYQRKCLTKRGRLQRKRRSLSAPAVMKMPEKKRRKKWTDEQMTAAMDAVDEGVCGVNHAAMLHGVPKTTLKNRLSGRVAHGINPGPKPYLNKDEEKELTTFLKNCSSMGYGKTRKDVLTIAETYARKKGELRKSKISDGWWHRFVERQNRSLVLRKGDSISFLRMDAMNKDTLKQYFDLLEETLKENNLENSPMSIYNVDETGIPLNPKTPKVVTAKSTKKVRYQSTGRKGQLTVVACGNACGQVIPPLIIFDAKNIRHAWTRNEVPGSKYGASDKGWINSDLFESWFHEHFLPNAVNDRPLLLLLDGHSTHYQPKTIRIAREHDVLILCLLPHTTHSTQPLDCGVFSPLKSHWKMVCHNFFQKNPGKIITKFNFNGLFSQAWLQSLVPANVIAGFKTCGIYPLNREALKAVPIYSNRSSSDKASAADNTALATNGIPKDDVVEEENEQPTRTESFQAPNEGQIGSDVLSREQEELFKRRYEEGYNLSIDPAYNLWLKKNYPPPLEVDCPSYSDYIEPVTNNSVSTNIGTISESAFSGSADYVDPVVATSSEYDELTLQDFLDITPLSPINVESTENPVATSQDTNPPVSTTGISSCDNPRASSPASSLNKSGKSSVRITSFSHTRGYFSCSYKEAYTKS